MKKHTLPAGLEEFLSAAELGSFSAAAHSLGVSRARMSQVISHLEHQLGLQLFHRSTRVISLTSAGEAFYQECRKGIDQLQFAVESAQEMRTTLSGSIRVNAVGGLFGEQILAPYLAQFIKKHPSVHLELDFSSVREDVIEAKYDLVVRMGQLEDSSLIGRPLTSYQNHAVASPDYLRNAPTLLHPKDLATHSLINGSVKKWTFYSQGKHSEVLDIPISANIQCSNGHVGRRLALEGLGITRQPSYYVKQDLLEGKLIQVLPDWTLAPSTANLIYPKARHPTTRVKALIDFLLDAFAD